MEHKTYSPYAIENRVRAILRADYTAMNAIGNSRIDELEPREQKLVINQWEQAGVWRRELQEMAKQGSRYAWMAYEYVRPENIPDQAWNL